MIRKILVVFILLGLFVGVGYLTHHFCCRLFLSKGLTHRFSPLKELKLSKEQKEKIDSLKKDLAKELVSLRKELATERIKLAQLLTEEKPGQKEIDKSIEKISSLLKEQQRKTISHTLKIKEILTPEQEKKFFSSLTQYFCEGCRAEIGSGECICGKCGKYW